MLGQGYYIYVFHILLLVVLHILSQKESIELHLG